MRVRHAATRFIGLSACVVLFGCGPETTDDDAAGDTTTSPTSSTGADESSGSTTGDPMPGDPGGLCVLAENGPTCAVEGAVCNEDGNFCYFPDAPCDGFTCGGEERGTCTPEAGLPSCTCMPGFSNEMYALYCCPLEGSDPYCG